MIQIKSLKLTDFGRHRSVNANFDGHVVGLTGPNGLGKSTVLQALQFAYTGTIETDPEEPMANFIRRSGGDAPKYAEVESEFEADGKKGRIVRRITRTSITRKLYWDGAEKPITSDKEVSEILTNIMGVDKKAINSTVFIRQGEMASMFGKETDRRDFYTRLLMLGHLAKVAGVIETHRAHMAGTVQDLGAVRDAAASAYEEARGYWESASAALAEAPSQADDLAAARQVLSAFENRDAAGEAADRARVSMSGLTAGEDPTEWLKRKQNQILVSSRELESLEALKNANHDAEMAAASAQRNVDELKRHAQLFDDVSNAERQLAAAKSPGEDPGPQLKRTEDTLRDLERKQALELSVPSRRAELDALRAALTAAEEAEPVSRADYDSTRDSYAAVQSQLKTRTELLRAVEGGNYDAHSGCPLCGSAETPNVNKLREDIAAGEQELVGLTARGKAAADRWHAAKSLLSDTAAKVNQLQPALESDETELKRLRVALVLTDMEATEATLAMLKEEQRVYAAAEFEVRRLTADVTAKKALTVGKICPDADVIVAAETALAAALQLKASSVWGDEQAQLEAIHRQTVKQGRSDLDAVQHQVATVSAAEQRFADANAALEAVLREVKSGFYEEVFTGASVLTVGEASAKLSLLEMRQQKHDEARGRLEAASESLRAASRKVDELDLRTAEQRKRLDLVRDLETLRDIFKPSGASLEFLNYKFGSIAAMAADYLAESGADFMVAASEEVPLSFEFLRTDGENEVWMSQNRLSGGQKVRLAVATLRAIHALVMPNVGLLVLDEPTTHLDDEAKRSMADMLHTIGEEGTLQMIICDHSPILVDAFSDIIQIN